MRMRTLNKIMENSVVINHIFSFSLFSLNTYIFYVFYQIVRSIDIIHLILFWMSKVRL